MTSIRVAGWRRAAEGTHPIGAMMALLLVVHGVSGYQFGAGWHATACLGLGVLGLAAPALRSLPAFWGTATSVLGFEMVTYWFALGNHHVLLGYLCAVMTIMSLVPPSQRRLVLHANGRALFVVLFAFATIHKATSPDFRAGAVLDFLVVQGSMGHGIVKRLPESTLNEMLEERTAIGTLLNDPPGQDEVVHLRRESIIRLVAVGAAMGIVVIEGVLVGLALLTSGTPLHWLIVVFVSCTGLMVREYAFLATVCVLGVSFAPRRTLTRLCYLALFTCLVSGAIWTELGGG